MSKRTCSVSGCTRPYKCKGYCSTHYSQILRTGSIHPVRQLSATGLCSFSQCDKPHDSLGYCTGHYTQLSRKQPLRPLEDRSLTPEQRFDANVNPGTSTACWAWKGHIDAVGYGRLWFDGKSHLAHRLAYEKAKGSIPAGSMVDHICHNTMCVNPFHLRLANKSQNGQNRGGAQANSKSGVRGVYWDKRDKRWVAYAHLNGQKKHIGMFLSMIEAEAAAIAWRKENMPYAVDQAASYAAKALDPA